MIENVRQAVQNANLYTYLGTIDKIVGTTVEAMGPACKIGDVCTIDVPGDNPPVKAAVVGFRENRVLLMPYEETEGIGYGSAVRNTGERLLIPVSNELIGRTVDAMGLSLIHILYRAGQMIQGVAKVNATTYDFYPFMTQAGRYQFRVRAIPKDTEEQGYITSGDWVYSDEQDIDDDQTYSLGAGRQNANLTPANICLLYTSRCV